MRIDRRSVGMRGSSEASKIGNRIDAKQRFVEAVEMEEQV